MDKLHEQLERLYVKRGLSIRAIADIYSVHPSSIHYWLKKYKIPSRAKLRKSRLLYYRIDQLEQLIEEEGYKRCAVLLGVHVNTLRHHIKVRKAAELTM